MSSSPHPVGPSRTVTYQWTHTYESPTTIKRRKETAGNAEKQTKCAREDFTAQTETWVWPSVRVRVSDLFTNMINIANIYIFDGSTAYDPQAGWYKWITFISNCMEQIVCLLGILLSSCLFLKIFLQKYAASYAVFGARLWARVLFSYLQKSVIWCLTCRRKKWQQWYCGSSCEKSDSK